MSIQRTLVFIKPDGVENNITEKVVKIFRNAKLRVASMKTVKAPEEKIREHYKEHEGKDYFERLIKFSLSGPIVLMVLEGEDSINKVRRMVGATDPLKAATGTIRATFGIGVPNNAIHASDSPESADREIKMWSSLLEVSKGEKESVEDKF